MSLTRITKYDPKPHLKFDSARQEWVCHDDYYIFGFGVTFKEAYLNWEEKSKRLTAIPRKYYRNIRSCMAWWTNGCKRIRTCIAIDGEWRYIWGYSPTTDELILRG